MLRRRPGHNEERRRAFAVSGNCRPRRAQGRFPGRDAGGSQPRRNRLPSPLDCHGREHLGQPSIELSKPGIAAEREPLFTANFLLASFASLSAFSSFYFLLATLPVYILRIGGSEQQVGLIIGVFSATAVLLRLPLGRAADERRKRPFILAGTALLTGSGLLYIAATNVPMLFGLRVLHGVGWALFGTTIGALVAEIVPVRRRGEAMGYYGMAANLAMAVGPALGVVLMRSYSFTALFLASAAMGLVSLALTLAIREPPMPPRLEQAKAERQGMVERSSLYPASVLLLTSVTYGSIVTFLPLYAAKRGVDNPGLFFSVYAVVLVVARGFTGAISDRRGRGVVIVPGIALCGLALMVLAFAQSLLGFMVVAVLYGLGFAALQPALMAMTVDRAPPGRRGAAMGTYSTAIDLGIGGGSLTWGFVVQTAGYPAMYLSAAGVALLAMVVFAVGARRTRA